MDCSQITCRQARVLRLRIARELNYLERLRRRMEVLGFPPDDTLYRATVRAVHAVHELHVRAHYLSCPSGVGAAPRSG